MQDLFAHREAIVNFESFPWKAGNTGLLGVVSR
jgi:hypothetical protein